MFNEPALLTSVELEFLPGQKQVSKSFEWKMKSQIRRKLRTFETLELPLLQNHGFDLTTNSKSATSNFVDNAKSRTVMHHSVTTAEEEICVSARAEIKGFSLVLHKSIDLNTKTAFLQPVDAMK